LIEVDSPAPRTGKPTHFTKHSTLNPKLNEGLGAFALSAIMALVLVWMMKSSSFDNEHIGNHDASDYQNLLQSWKNVMSRVDTRRELECNGSWPKQDICGLLAKFRSSRLVAKKLAGGTVAAKGDPRFQMARKSEVKIIC
jgi:hypothetical protein